jgi:uncharacterized protein
MNDQLRELSVLTTQECVDLLGRGCVGRVAFADVEQIHVLPVNYLADEEARVVFRTGRDTMLAARASRPVTFEVDAVDARTRTGWSVCVHGVAREVTDADDVSAVRARRLPVRPWAPGQREVWFVIIPLTVTGRRISFTSDDPADYWFSGIPTS